MKCIKLYTSHRRAHMHTLYIGVGMNSFKLKERTEGRKHSWSSSLGFGSLVCSSC